MKTTTLALLAGALTAALLSPAQAEGLTPTGVTLHTVTRHSKPTFNDNNPGIGLQWLDEQRLDGLAVGAYRNSECRARMTPDRCKESAYAAYMWQWKLTDKVKAGVAVGAVTGYTAAPVLPLVTPSLAYSASKGVDVRVTWAPKFQQQGAHAFHLTVEYSF
jgi:hypothetical protein